jgi:hypothetical protein
MANIAGRALARVAVARVVVDCTNIPSTYALRCEGDVKNAGAAFHRVLTTGLR